MDGKYLFSCFGGQVKGYEGDPLSIGLATTENLLSADSYQLSPAPVLSGLDADARRGESLTLYKANIVYDEQRTSGYPYLCAYNAKDETHRESIFLAVSEDGLHWKRWLKDAIIPAWECADDVLINGDPQIVLIDDYISIMYFCCIYYF